MRVLFLFMYVKMYVCMCMYVWYLFEYVLLVVPQSDIGHNEHAVVFLSLDILHYELGVLVGSEGWGSLTCSSSMYTGMYVCMYVCMYACVLPLPPFKQSALFGPIEMEWMT